jgi:tetratricopeptide (TPR) repeat protein
VRLTNQKTLSALVIVSAVAFLVSQPFAQAYRPGQFPGEGVKEDWLRSLRPNNVGNHFRERREFAEAIKNFETAIDFYPYDFRYYKGLGLCYLQRSGNPSDALKAQKLFAKALRIYKGDWETWNALGDSLKRQGKNEQAQQSYEKALENDPPENEIAILKKKVASLN